MKHIDRANLVVMLCLGVATRTAMGTYPVAEPLRSGHVAGGAPRRQPIVAHPLLLQPVSNASRGK
jgi:hypothetical protein